MFANVIIECSSGLPILTGRLQFEFMRRTKPFTRSDTYWKDLEHLHIYRKKRVINYRVQVYLSTSGIRQISHTRGASIHLVLSAFYRLSDLYGGILIKMHMKQYDLTSRGGQRRGWGSGLNSSIHGTLLIPFYLIYQEKPIDISLSPFLMFLILKQFYALVLYNL